MRRPRAPASRAATCAAMLCAASLCADAASSHKPRPPKPASSPSTAQILAPSAAAPPDALPLDKTIYRCGNSYSSHPCADGGAPLAVADTRSDDQRRQSDELTARDKRLAAWLEAGRRERDSAASAPTKARAAAHSADCVETAAITCQPKKPRPRHAVAKTASGAAARLP